MPDAQPGPPATMLVTMYLTPKETILAMASIGIKKANLPWDRVLLLAIVSGIFVGFGAGFALSVAGGCPGLPENGLLGIQRLLLGGTFSVALMLIVITGGELFTGNSAMLVLPLLGGKVTVLQLLWNWFLVYFGNFFGCVACAYLLFYVADVNVNDEPWKSFLHKLIVKKVQEPGWGQLVLRGIGCNYLVTLAVFFCVSAQDINSKIWATFFPIMAFAATGFEHCIANMFFIPLALMSVGNTEGIHANFGDFVAYNLIPVTIGNIIGGSLLMASIFWYTYANPNRWLSAPHPEDKKDHFSLSEYLSEHIWHHHAHGSGHSNQITPLQHV